MATSHIATTGSAGPHWAVRRICAPLAVTALFAAPAAMLSATPAVAAPASTAVSQTGPGSSSWTVPAGVAQVRIFVAGGGGGSSTGPDGEVAGYGGETADGAFPVAPGDVLQFTVGGVGGDSSGPTGGAGGTGGTAGTDGEDGTPDGCVTDGEPADCPGGGGGGGATVVTGSSGLSIAARGGTGAQGVGLDESDQAITAAGGPGGGTTDCSGTATGTGCGSGTVGQAQNGSVQIAVTAVTTTTTVQSSANPATSGADVDLTAVVSNAFDPATAPTGGTVTFQVGSTELCTAVPVVAQGGAGIAGCRVSQPGIGTHHVTAQYTGSGLGPTGYSFAASTGYLDQVVTKAGVAVSLAVAPQTMCLVPGTSAPVVTGVVSADDDGVPTGPVVVSVAAGDQDARSFSVPLDGHAGYRIALPGLAEGTYSLTADYAGDGTYDGSTSASQSLVITGDCPATGGETTEGDTEGATSSRTPPPSASGDEPDDTSAASGHADGSAAEPAAWKSQTQPRKPELAKTGIATGHLLGAALLLLAGGGTALWVGHRRRGVGRGSL